jgi:acetyl esterase/lipase
MKLLGIGYAIYTNIAIFFIFLGNFIGFSENIWSNLGLGILIYGNYFGLFIYGAWMAYLTFSPTTGEKIQGNNTQKVLKPRISRKSKDTLRKILLLGCVFWLVSGIFIVSSLFFALQGGFSFFAFGIFAGQAGVFFGLSFLSVSTILVQTYRPLKTSLRSIKISIFIIGVLISGSCFVPLLSTPGFTQEADDAFSLVYDPMFSGDWKAEIANAGIDDYLLRTPFSLPGYFLGPTNPECIVISDVLYFDGDISPYAVDDGVKLYFDAYLPPNSGIGLPGENSTLIRIHGGGWGAGDKNLGNMPSMNRYFAAQGYCVFDIQHGLTTSPESMKIPMITPPNVLGNFSLDDMMRHIGNFTTYLETHVDNFGANLDSTFISGGSAGGQLASATALSITNGAYSDTFSSAITVKGLIPFYPANNVSMDFAQTSRPEWRNPEILVTPTSPPCLIYQGDQDFLIYRALSFQETYVNLGNDRCCVLIFPYAGHASDLYFPGYYNQVFLFYMERFMYLFH